MQQTERIICPESLVAVVHQASAENALLLQ